jgi:hypothetical protein
MNGTRGVGGGERRDATAPALRPRDGTLGSKLNAANKIFLNY